MSDKYRFEHANGGSVHTIEGPWRVKGPGIKNLLFMDREMAAVIAKTLNEAWESGIDAVLSKLRANVTRDGDHKTLDRLSALSGYIWICNANGTPIRGCGTANSLDSSACNGCGAERQRAFNRDLLV